MKVTREHALKAEITVALLIVAVLSISLYRPSTTGFVPANVQHTPLDLEISKSQVYKIRFNETVGLQSFGMSGSVAGNGTVYVFLDNREGERLLVYTNVKQVHDLEGAGFITGLATAEIVPGQVLDTHIPLGDGEELMAGTFVNECFESCTTPAGFSRDAYDLTFLVQPGVRLNIAEIIYITE